MSIANSAINKHYLNKVMDMAEHMTIEASVDIFDVHGMKLLAKGSKVTRGLQERLIAHKLRQPFETSIRVGGGVGPDAVLAMATRLIDTSAPLTSILRATGNDGGALLSMLYSMEFGNAMGMMLTVSDQASSEALEHAVMMSLLSICMAKKLCLDEQQQKVAGLAGLLHDIGELYIDPAYLARDRRLLPHEWSHVVVHPRIGQLLIDELESYPSAVGRAVAEHHERFDGSGYPRQIAGAQISAPGQAVAVAEMISSLLKMDHPLERAELALKIVPGEHAHPLLSAVSGALRLSHGGAPQEHADYEDTPLCESVEHLFSRITSILELGNTLLDTDVVKSAKTRGLVLNTLGRVRNIERAFLSTGLDVYVRAQPAFIGGADCTLRFEKDVASSEIKWRLRDIARDLALHAGAPDEAGALLTLINILDDHDAPLPVAPVVPSAPLHQRVARPAPAAMAGMRG